MIDGAVAQDEFNRFLELMDIDNDPSHMSGEDRVNFDKLARTITKAIETGRLVVNDDGEPVFTPAGFDSPMTFHEPTGATYMSIDRRKDGQNVAKLHAMLADMTKQPPDVFAKMKARDYKVAQAVIMLFLG